MQTKNFIGKLILDEDRAFYYVVHLVDAPDIQAPKSSFAFSSFSYFTDPTYSRYAGIKPDNPFGGGTEFFNEGLTRKYKELLYQVVRRYINPGKISEPSDVNIDLVTADGYIVQTWENEDCQITDFKSSMDDVLVRYKFQHAFEL